MVKLKKKHRETLFLLFLILALGYITYQEFRTGGQFLMLWLFMLVACILFFIKERKKWE